ncbi:MAG: carbohydrate ABC transporter permease [Deltaproteobacteria bacterium]|nr:carbohydrate ABC transporter permease [Deltaproteobacteria bacterium]MBW2120515.1 carbohydrate ABC transporter permease [Deltaproteobacteria bacterium]
MGKSGFFSLRGQVVYWCAALLLLATAFPFFWMISTSFKPLREIFVFPPHFLPTRFTLANFERLFGQTRFLTYFRNSIFVSTSAVLLTMVIATAGAYSLTRFKFYGREKIASLILFTYMFAPIMIVIPFYVLIRKIGIANTHLALIMAYTAFCLPFSLWLLRAFFQSIPMVLEEAALTDGAGRIRALIYVILPLALPGIIATSVFTFILAWNDYIFVRILITSDELKTLSVGIADLYNATVIDWGMIMSGGMLITVPVVVFFIFVQRYLIAGWGAGAMKG